jgi:transposase
VERLKSWGGRFLPAEKAEALAQSARSTRGLVADRWEETTLRRCAVELLQGQEEIRRSRRRLEELASGHRALEAMSEVVGASTACVLWTELGDPGRYHCGSAYRKAMGLNLAERSSGAWKGQLKISKRGSSRARRWLYLAALRWVKREPVRSWYARQMSHRRGATNRGATKRGAAKPVLVGVMRKLALALYQVAGRGEAFDAQQLYRSLTKTNT